MTPSEIVEKIIELCLKDEKWREAFSVPNFFSCYGGMGFPDCSSDRLISIELHENDYGLDYYNIPLTQLLLSPETVRVCQEARFKEFGGTDAHLMNLAVAINRLKYYEDYFIKPIMGRGRR